MNKLMVLVVGALVTLTQGTALAAGPTWCKGSEFEADDYRLDGLSSKNVKEVIVTFAKAMCAPSPEASANHAQIEAARQAWSKKLDMTEADWADAVAYASISDRDRIHLDVRVDTKGQEMGIGSTLKRAWSSFDAFDQYVMIKTNVGASGDFALDYNYLTDAFGTRLTETGRFAYIRRCLNDRTGPVQWAMCQGDIDQLDFKKLATELRTNTARSGADKMLIRFAIHALKPELVAHAARVKTLIASDPGYGKMFEAGVAVRKEWTGRYKADAALIELASTMDDARATKSRKAFAGCQEQTWAAWKAALAEVPAKKFEGMHDDRANGKRFTDAAMGPMLSDPRVYLAAIALNTCNTTGQDRGEKRDHLVVVLRSGLQNWPGFRGPRTATQSAIMTTGIELDDRDARIDYPGVNRDFDGGDSHLGGGSGVIAKLKPAGTTVTVEFKKQMVKQVQCAQYKYSRKIVQIRSSGELVYESWCVKKTTVTVDKSDNAQTVNPRYLEGVKPGMFVSIVGQAVVAVWAKPDSATPLMVYGVKLK